MFGSAFLSIYSLLQKYDFFVVKTKNGEAFPRQLSLDMLFSFRLRHPRPVYWAAATAGVEVFARCRAQIKVALSKAEKKCKSLGEKLPAFARKRSTFAQNVSCFSCRWCAVVWNSCSGAGKSFVLDSQLGENEEDRDEKTLPPPTVGHTVGRERRKKNVCTGSDYFFCDFTGAAGCSTSAL